MTTASACPACLGDAHLNCTGTQPTPCACGCLPSAASLHRWSLHTLAVHDQPRYQAVSRRIEALRADGKPVD